ncbi:MAG: hypothetical protein ABJN42_29110 [Roseibium sp.]|uniref:type II secretion system protein n=1 Tax=Roseibium sp. TaxID=1936156 RepID=UPI003298C9E9
MKKTFAKMRQRGYGLIEVILAIAITLGLIVGGIVLFNQSQLASNTTDASRAIVSISSESRALYRTAPDFSNLTGAELMEAGAVAANLIVGEEGSEAIILPYEGTVTVGPNATEPREFDVSVAWDATNDNARALCTRLAAEVSPGGVGPLGTGYTATNDCVNGNLTATFTR